MQSTEYMSLQANQIGQTRLAVAVAAVIQSESRLLGLGTKMAAGTQALWQPAHARLG